MLGLSMLGSVIVSRVSSTLPHKLSQAGVSTRLAHQLAGTAHGVAQGLVVIPNGVSASTARAITTGSQLAFTTGLDAAMAIAAAIVGVTGIAAFAACQVAARRNRAAVVAPSPSETMAAAVQEAA